ncbi:hypothetical protein JCGZ_13729 [Jatropha curcas]|uniref:Uncharacterized protein n=1 Tax=Jatropha curcas TaxID=180498 RepID=A0A067K3K5_JATCU|nr:hypothetical protein JCGZ_13729 [Jatropha curcas]
MEPTLKKNGPFDTSNAQSNNASPEGSVTKAVSVVAQAKEQRTSGEANEAAKKPPTVQVFVALVKQLREEIGAGMMECKKAVSKLEATLRREHSEQGKGARDAERGPVGEVALLEQPFIKDNNSLLVLMKDLVKQTVGALGESIKVRRFKGRTVGFKQISGTKENACFRRLPMVAGLLVCAAWIIMFKCPAPPRHIPVDFHGSEDGMERPEEERMGKAKQFSLPLLSINHKRI